MVQKLGFYGKIPARGDFVSRGLDHNFIHRWDEWLQSAIRASRAALQDRWLDLYLVGPIWRFYLSRGICGDSAVAGVMIPSVDAVGRYFPFMVGTPIDESGRAEGSMAPSESWYDAVEARTLRALEPDFDLHELDQPLAQEFPRFSWQDRAARSVPKPGLCIASTDCTISSAMLDFISEYDPPLALFWTNGSIHVQPCCLVCGELPAAESCTSMLDGDWRQCGWITVPANELADSNLATGAE
jgi:type VI secretion system protein ImpM